MDVILEYIVSALIIAFALVAVEVRDLMRMAASFSIMSILIAVAFYMMDAPYVSVFQLAINAGAVTVLFLALMHVLKKRRLE
jgi:uncharacterized MnhB-related membrane protein